MQDISSIGRFYKNMGILLGGLSDCEELVGVTWRVSDLWRIKWELLTGGGEVGFGGYWY